MWLWLQHSDWTTMLQLALDGLLLFLVLVLLWNRRRKVPLETSNFPLESFERILSETKALSEEFDRNLRERGRLIQNFLDALDAKLAEARGVLKQLQQQGEFPAMAGTAARPEPASKAVVERILHLADAGSSPQEIAARIHRPVGEVELVLNLHKLQQKKSDR